MTPLSNKQKKALEMIKKIEDHFGSRWFTQAELPGITMHTMCALIERGHLISKYVEEIEYYQLKVVVDVLGSKKCTWCDEVITSVNERYLDEKGIDGVFCKKECIDAFVLSAVEGVDSEK